MTQQGWAAVTGIGHVRLTVTDIDRSKQFYQRLLGSQPVIDMSEHLDQPGVREDPERFFGGCVFQVGDQVLGLRPATTDARFDPAGVGLDHVSLAVASVDDLHASAARLDEAGVDHGEIRELSDAGMVILSFQDPDDINVELTALLSR